MWDFHKADTEHFRNSFINFDWDNLVKDDINETCTLFTDKSLFSAGEFIPHNLRLCILMINLSTKVIYIYIDAG